MIDLTSRNYLRSLVIAASGRAVTAPSVHLERAYIALMTAADTLDAMIARSEVTPPPAASKAHEVAQRLGKRLIHA